MRNGRGLSRLYAILDVDTIAARQMSLIDAATVLREAGVRLLQLRAKQSTPELVVQSALTIGNIFSGSGATLILNDRPELVPVCRWHGVHLGQNDCSPSEARALIGQDALLGLSTHTIAQAVSAEEQGSVDYIAFGPIFATQTKLDPEQEVGLAGLREVRPSVTKPLVAIGGISAQNAPAVFEAGADAIAIIGALFPPDGSVAAAARAMLSIADL